MKIYHSSGHTEVKHIYIQVSIINRMIDGYKQQALSPQTLHNNNTKLVLGENKTKLHEWIDIDPISSIIEGVKKNNYTTTPGSCDPTNNTWYIITEVQKRLISLHCVSDWHIELMNMLYAIGTCSCFPPSSLPYERRLLLWLSHQHNTINNMPALTMLVSTYTGRWIFSLISHNFIRNRAKFNLIPSKIISRFLWCFCYIKNNTGL